MKTKSFLALLVSILFLAMVSCRLFDAPTPALVSPTEELSTAIPAAAASVTSTFPPLTPTISAPAKPLLTTPSTAAPQPAAPGHFHPGDPIRLDEIHMLSSTEGWAISGPYVLVTLDGGLTWRETTPPEVLPADTSAKAFGAFFDKQTAWIIFSQNNQILPEASVWHTTDGGNTWMPGASLLHQVNAEMLWAEFAVLDPKNIWLMVRGVYVGAGTHFTHELFRTTDGGLTWTSLDGEISDDYTGMVFVDTSTGWRTWQTTGAYASAPPAYGVTIDGGANWDSRELPPPADATGLFDQYPYCEPYQLSLSSARSIRLLVGCFDVYSPPKEFTSYLYTSEDGGATWSTYLLPDKVMASNDRLIYFDADNANALLLGRNIYRSADGGRTWFHVKTVSWGGQFSFVDPQNGWAVARSNNEIALVKTSDGGDTWTQIKPVIAK